MRRIFITGGFGFIGSWLARKALEAGDRVGLVDCLENYGCVPEPVFSRNLDLRRRWLEPCTIFHTNLLEREHLVSALEQFQPTHIVHLASNPLANQIEQDPTLGFNSIYHSTFNILQAMTTVKPKHFIYVSSSMVYGNFLAPEVSEESDLTPVNYYGLFKKQGEELTKAFCRQSGTAYTIIRPASVYGTTDNNARVLYRFIHSAATLKTITVYDESEYLDFTHVDDLSDGIYKAIVRPQAENETFNLTFGRARPVIEAAGLIKSYFPNTEIQVTRQQRSGPRRGTLDIRKAREHLGFEPKTSLEAGLDSYIEDLRRMEVI
jgi:nucleoside-diphosphate-sugar epimerase